MSSKTWELVHQFEVGGKWDSTMIFCYEILLVGFQWFGTTPVVRSGLEESELIHLVI